ncbi:TPR repeat-containing protein [Salix suchowensis]|nr:TPR repeat-containing protein [Salix suchowensis]
MGELVRLLVAIALLHAFIQVNWTGPDLDVKPLEIIQGEAVGLTNEILNIKATSELAYGGEPAYHLTKHPFLLRLAQLLLESPYHHCKSIPWWRLRATTVHQHVLDETVAPPPSVLASIETQTESIASDPELTGRLHLEVGLLEHILSQDRAASNYFLRAIRATGLQYELTGALGKRTKFQQNDLSQLVLLAESQLSVANTSETSATEISGPLPETLALNDDTLLEQTQFTTSDPTLRKVGLAISIHHANCRLFRSRASALFSRHTLPSKWELERELALQFLKLGVVKSALEIFERLEMWEEVVKCWGSLDKPEKAKAIVRDLLEGKKDEAENVIVHGKDLSKDRRVYLDAAREAKLWCLLGDLEPESAVEHYSRAWEVSNQTSGRAMRSLGGYYFARWNMTSHRLSEASGDNQPTPLPILVHPRLRMCSSGKMGGRQGRF